MLDMGFIHAIRQIVKMLPKERQNLMFSATYSEDIRALAARMLRNPVAIEVAARNATADRIEQHVYRVPKDHKRHLLAHLIEDGNWQQVLVFTRTKHGANRLSQQLEGSGISSAAIHGNKSQGARVRALSDFKEGRVTALVATEVAARGPGHQGTALRRELRAAERAGGLRPPHRPHRPRRRQRRGRVARISG